MITAVGTVGPGRRELDARGKLVTPGFVDMHTHYDAQVSWDPQLTPSSWHGCTTVVMGNCGVGFAPAAPDRHDWLIGLMEGVEDIPGAAMVEGIQWGWESFPEYLDAIERQPHAIDFGAQIPHGALRAYVMGDRAEAADDTGAAATADDIGAMYSQVKRALLAGALGFSTSRTVLHKSIDGVPVPGTFAAEDELFGIGQALADTRSGVFQLAAEHIHVTKELGWMRELARRIERPVMFNLTQTDFTKDLWRDLLPQLEEAAADGVPLYGQVAGRAIGILMNFELTAHPFALHPTFEAIAADATTREELFTALRRPDVRARLLAEAPRKVGFFEQFVTQSFHKMFPMGPSVNYEPAPDVSIAAQAKATGRTPQELVYDALLEDEGRAMLYFPLFNYADGGLDLLATLHQHPQTRMGLSDAGAHCGAVCDGGMPTFMLTHWTRDRTRGERLPLEHVIRRQTSETAHTYGLLDRGVVAPGYRADLNVIDYQALRFEKPKIVYDLPAGGRRLVQRARGYEATVCAGEIISLDGEATGALPGKLVRGAQPAPV